MIKNSLVSHTSFFYPFPYSVPVQFLKPKIGFLQPPGEFPKFVLSQYKSKRENVSGEIVVVPSIKSYSTRLVNRLITLLGPPFVTTECDPNTFIVILQVITI